MVQPCQFWQKTLKSGRFLQQYCTRVPQNKGTKKEPVGAFHVVRLRRILLRLYLGLPLGAGRRAIDLPDKRGSLTDPYYCDRVSWMTHHNHVDHLGGVLFETHGTCVRQVYLRGSLNGLTWLLFCDSVTGFSKIQAIHGSQERQSIGIELPEILRCCAVFSPLLTLRQPRWSSLHRFLAAVVFFQPRSLGRSFDEMLATCL